MADKAISQLNAATSVTSVDLFVLEQSGEAKKLTGQILENWLVSFADGHGGIQSITKTGSTGTNPVIDTYTILLADETTTTFQVVNGIKGDTGDQTYVWIRYAHTYPTADSDMGTSPDEWIGIYSGTSTTAPTHYTDYTWYQFKGETGDTGAAATITAATVGYQQSDSGSVVPEGSWTTTVPTPVAGKFLWTRIQIQFNTGSPITAYSVARYGIDGTGAVSSVNSVSPDATGNVQLLAADIQTLDSQSIQAHLDDAEDDIAELKTSLNGKMANWVLLWTNASPTSNFPIQTVSLDLSEYDFVCVPFFSDTGNSRGATMIFPKNGVPQRVGIPGRNQNRLNFLRRDITVSATGLYFDAGMADYSTQDGVTSDTIMIPDKIYGIKGVTV